MIPSPLASSHEEARHCASLPAPPRFSLLWPSGDSQPPPRREEKPSWRATLNPTRIKLRSCCERVPCREKWKTHKKHCRIPTEVCRSPESALLQHLNVWSAHVVDPSEGATQRKLHFVLTSPPSKTLTSTHEHQRFKSTSTLDQHRHNISTNNNINSDILSHMLTPSHTCLPQTHACSRIPTHSHTYSHTFCHTPSHCSI